MSKRKLIRYLVFIFYLLFSNDTFGHVTPLTRFVENKGQWNEKVLFKASIPGGDLYILKNKLKYVFYQKKRRGHHDVFDDERNALRASSAQTDNNLFHSVELSFPGSNSSSATTGEQILPEVLNFIKGNDEQSWTAGVRSFTGLIIKELYEGIDFHMYTASSGLKYDFIVYPGANPGKIKMKYDGQDELRIHNGKVVVGTIHGHFFENAPVSYVTRNLKKESVATGFELSNNVISFHFPEGYDGNSKLIIDPELIFSTFSGSFADNWGFTATYDEEGNLYSGGIVNNVGFPTSNGVFQRQHAGEWDVGILKYDPEGKNLLWATYLGGSFSETPQSIIVNNQGQLVIYGTTSSPDFPMVSNAYQKTFLGGDSIDQTEVSGNPRLVGGIRFQNGSDIFLAILGENGQSLVGSTFIGGTANDGIMERLTPLTKNYGDQFRGEVIVDSGDNIYIASNTSSPDFPVKNGAQTTYGGGSNDGLVMKFNPDLTELYWSTFAGGSGMDALFSVKVDSKGNVFASGGSNSIDFPVTEGTMKKEKPLAFDVDGVVVKISSDGSEILKGTYVGTSSYDQVYFLELDSFDHIYLLGQTQGNYPVTANVYANPNSGQFIHKLGNDLDSTYFSTVIGAGRNSPDFSPTAFLVNECENIFVSGWGGVLNSPGFGYIGGSTIGLPITNNAFQSQTDGTDFYLMVLLQDAKQLLYGTYFGEINGRGEHVDGGTSRFDKKGIVYQSVCGGCGGSSGFPTWPPDVWSRNNNGPNCNNAAFKFDLASLLAQFETDTEDFTNRGIREGCYSLTLVFLNESLGGEDFRWEFGEGTITEQEDSITITYENPGVYPVILTATDINTCVRESQATGLITVYDYDFDIMPDDSICFGESITLNASGGVYYDWRPKNSLQNANSGSPIATPDSTTVYAVSIEDQNGCSEEDSLTIKVIPRVMADFAYQKSYDCVTPPVVSFRNNSENASDFIWDFGDGNSSEEFEPVHRFEASDSIKTFNVTLTAGESFCSANKSVPITSVSTFVPNFVSPNGDGKNDVFEIVSDDQIELHIYNRWGKEVYQSQDYRNNWQASDLASGVYYYEITLSDKNTRCNGWVQVMR